ncbi:MAG: aminotransferase class V-fold PLP-dependent enzyme [Planctomycetota bacterium]
MKKNTLAIFGAEPAFPTGTFGRQFEMESVKQAVTRSLETGQWSQYDGDFTEELKSALSRAFDCQQVMLCCSGTIAVELALRGASVRQEDEVILAGYDFPGNFRAIEAIGAMPVLVDVVPEGWVMDPSQIASAFSDKTKAIVVSHLHGQTADIQRIREIVDKQNERSDQTIRIVEDVCQSAGGRIHDRPLGTLGDVSVLSFGGSKLLSAGRGGAVLTNDESMIQRIKVFAERGNDAFPFSQLQAAVLTPQVEHLAAFTQQRFHAIQQWATFVNQWNHAELRLGVDLEEGQLPAFYKIPFRLAQTQQGWTRDQLVSAAEAEGIPIGIGFRGFINRSRRRCRKPLPLDNCRAAIEQTVLLHHGVLDADEQLWSQLIETLDSILEVDVAAEE